VNSTRLNTVLTDLVDVFVNDLVNGLVKKNIG